MDDQRPAATDAQVDFLMTDLDVGMTFVQMAGDDVHPAADRQRHLTNAREAYATVTYHFGQVRTRPSDTVRIEQGLATLKGAIDAVRSV